MKISILTTLLVLFSSITFGQKVELNKSLTYILPKNAEMLSATKIASLKINEKASFLSPSSLGKKFRVNDVVLLVNGGEIRSVSDKNYLKDLEKGMKEMIGWAKPAFYESSIKTYNGFETLLIGHELPGGTTGHYSFFCLNMRKDNILTGQMQYNIGNRKKALSILNELVESIRTYE